jgi:putative ABC transport system permease protein
MLRNYLTVAFRGFWRNKIFSFIHVLGLSIGISAALVIYLIVRYEMSFDKFEPDGDRIYRVVMDFNFNGAAGHSAAVPAPLAVAMEAEVTGVEGIIPVMQFQGDATARVLILHQNSGKPEVFKKQPDVVFTTSDYFNMLPHKWLAGSPRTALKDPFSVVITESRAHQYFPNTAMGDIIGRQITYNDDLHTTVTGVVKDLEETTAFTSKEFIAHNTIAKTALHGNFMMDRWDDWMAYSTAYVKLLPANDKAGVETQMDALFRKNNARAKNDPNNSTNFRLQPLSDIHFNANYASFSLRTAHKPTLYGLLAIAIFLLLLGCINFTNLSTAQASHRAREIGIRKTIGSSKKQLVVQFLSETLCITAMATGLSVCIAPLLLEVFTDFIPRGVTFEITREPSLVLFLIVLTLVVSFLAGLYPALILSGFRPAAVLKNRSAMGSITGGVALRKVLTVSQFVIAQFFVIAAFMVGKQIHFSLNHDLGYRKEAILNFDIPRDTVAGHRDRLINEITTMPEVQMVSTGYLPPAMAGASFGNISFHNGKDEIKINVQIRWGDPDFIRLYKIKIVAGRNVHAGKNINEALINEAYARELGFTNPQDALDKELTMGNGTKTPIVGVMRNFHEGSFHGAIGPLVFRASTTGTFFHVALAPQDAEGKAWPHAIQNIQKIYNEIYPEVDFRYSFFDDTLAQLYEREQNTARLLNWATGLSIFISCLGLLGLVIYTAETRTKEIGIRKILGASVTSILSILSLEFIRLVLIAFAIASPLAWWAVDQWLQSFAYRTPMSWWVFALSGLFLIVAAVGTLSTQIIKTATTNPINSLRME